MELINRYVAAVGHKLPEKMRQDVEKELHSLIMDELEAEHGPSDTYTEDQVVAVLERLGPPQEVAARYAPSSRYLIGPQMYDTYLMVTGIVIGAAVLGVTISLLFADYSMSFADDLGKIISTLLSAAFGAFANTTLVFAIIERVLPDKDKQAMVGLKGKWDPRQLPTAPPASARVKISDSIATICFTIIALVVVNAFDLKTGFYFDRGQWHALYLLDQTAVALYRPYWNAIWVATLVQHAVLLARREWTVGTRVFSIIMSVLGIAMLAFMIGGPPLLNPEGFQVLEGKATATDFLALGHLLQTMLRVGFILGIIGSVIDIIKKGYQLLKALVQGTQSV